MVALRLSASACHRMTKNHESCRPPSRAPTLKVSPAHLNFVILWQAEAGGRSATIGSMPERCGQLNNGSENPTHPPSTAIVPIPTFPQHAQCRPAFLPSGALMADLVYAFPITARWPAKRPDLLQLYSFPTPNGVKVSIALEEIGLPYEAHLVNILKNDTWDAGFPFAQSERQDFLSILDPDGPAANRLHCSNWVRSCSTLPKRRASCCLPILPAATRPFSGSFSRWAASARCSGNWASSTNSPDGKSPTNVRWSAIATNEAAARRAGNAAEGPAMDHG